ncbi:TPM domain-containing protein [Sphingobium sufflavum]|uniref:TPM domain-containing protein n=1 Tax=Sphingobium sufflavum TaxID=1129547 RepID=UPI001F266181|nr:TPM domain-containing protein [Sphingobium sufflavum]MCE7797515.1 TPM domain-containing protein [Sphingobium sufflavum]
MSPARICSDPARPAPAPARRPPAPSAPALRPLLQRLALLLLLALATALVPTLAHAQDFPALTGRVVDGANLLDPAGEQALDARLAALEKDTGRQLVVATIPDLQGRDIADYGYRLGRVWGIGAKGRNDGALLIVAPNERRVRIEVGYGLEGVLTDATSALIIANAITPRFKAGDFPGGITAGVEEIGALLKLTPEEAKARAAAMAAEADRQEGSSDVMSAVIVLLFVGLFVVLPLVSRARGGKRYGGGGIGAAPIILWGPGLGGGRDDDHGGGFGGFGGGGSGGGFSGGGGSFGGGGASGGW